jgi:hypothetical protein
MQSQIISLNLGVLASGYDWDEDGAFVSEGSQVACCSLFLIGKEGIIRHYVIND